MSNLLSISNALKMAYSSFIKNGFKRTAIFEFYEFRRSILKNVDLSFTKYQQRLGTDGYEIKKLQVYMHMAEMLGANLIDKGSEIVEKKEVFDELSSRWLINCYLHTEEMPKY